MDDSREQQLKPSMKEKTKQCQKLVSRLLEEYESLLLKQTQTAPTGDSAQPVEQAPLVADVTTQLMDIELALESIQQHVQLAFEKYRNTLPDLSTSTDDSTPQSEGNQMEIDNVSINQQVGPSDENAQNVAKRIATFQALFAGTLPDDFFLHLMSVMGIQDCLLSNRLVCLLWNELVLERCRNQRSLKLFESFDNLMDYGELMLKYEKTNDASLILKSIGDDLLFDGFQTDYTAIPKTTLFGERGDNWHRMGSTYDENGGICSLRKVDLAIKKKRDAIKLLTSHFTKMEELVICASEYNTFIDIEHLLKLYAKKITSLTLTNFGSTIENPGGKLRAFSFPMLKVLNTFHFSPEEEQLLSLLPQLESLTMECAKMSLESLLRAGTQLRELNLEIIQSVYTAPVDKVSKRPPINNNLRKFSFEYAPTGEIKRQSLEFISQNLISLETLKLNIEYRHIHIVPHLHSLMPYLVPLQQLDSLTLQAPVSFFLLDDNQFAEIKPLPSVRRLKLLLYAVEYGNDSLSSMERFSRALFAAFPHVEQVHIAFAGNARAGTARYATIFAATFAAFEDFASKHSSVVRLFRSKNLSKLTNLPNAVSPLLGNHRQMYEEVIDGENLFGVPIFKLVTSLASYCVSYFRPKLKILLRPADRLAAMSNFFKLLKSNSFNFTFETVNRLVWQLSHSVLKCDPSEGAMFIVTSKCILSLLDCQVCSDEHFDEDSLDESDSDEHDWGSTFLDSKYLDEHPLFEMMLKLAEHYKKQKFNDKDLRLQLFNRIVKFLTKFNSISNGCDERICEHELFEVLLNLTDVFDSDGELVSQIHELIDDQLKKFDSETLDEMISEYIRSTNRVSRVEMARALLRCCESTDNYFK